jgi:hypothetical protein
VKKGNTMNLSKDDFSYTIIDCSGYQITYKGIRIGGAGAVCRLKRYSKKNMLFYCEQAQIDIRNILAGKIRPDYLQNIEKINNSTKKC